jgi:hypothetical protein
MAVIIVNCVESSLHESSALRFGRSVDIFGVHVSSSALFQAGLVSFFGGTQVCNRDGRTHGSIGRATDS